MRVACAALALLILSAVACNRPDWRIAKLYGGPGSVELLTSPERVEAFRVDPMPAEPQPGESYLGHYRITAGPLDVPADARAELSSILADPDTYDFYRAKDCKFLPAVGFRFHRQVSYLDVALCFSCDELMIFRQGRVVNLEDFDDARPRLVALVKRLFPDDEDLQGL